MQSGHRIFQGRVGRADVGIQASELTARFSIGKMIERGVIIGGGGGTMKNVCAAIVLTSMLLEPVVAEVVRECESKRCFVPSLYSSLAINLHNDPEKPESNDRVNVAAPAISGINVVSASFTISAESVVEVRSSLSIAVDAYIAPPDRS
jgi:hypothetical protein